MGCRLRLFGLRQELIPHILLPVGEYPKAEIRQMADELLRLYAERKAAVGEAVPPADDDYQAFEATFPFDETADQARAIGEVLGDLDRAVSTYEAALNISRASDQDGPNWHANHALILINIAQVRSSRKEHLLANVADAAPDVMPCHDRSNETTSYFPVCDLARRSALSTASAPLE